MEKMVITSGENKINVDTGLTGNGTSENPLQYTDEIQQFNSINFKVYKMNNLLSIYYGKEKLTDFIIKMKQLL